VSRANAYDIPSSEIALHFWRKAMTETRRDLIKKVFVFPIVLTWPVQPSFARSGSDSDFPDAPPDRDGVKIPLKPTPGKDGDPR
jgi:hypothetical protein